MFTGLQDDINSLSKEQDPKVTQQINFTGNLKREGNTTFFIIEESKKKTILDFSQGTVNCNCFFILI